MSEGEGGEGDGGGEGEGDRVVVEVEEEVEGMDSEEKVSQRGTRAESRVLHFSRINCLAVNPLENIIIIWINRIKLM